MLHWCGGNRNIVPVSNKLYWKKLGRIDAYQTQRKVSLLSSLWTSWQAQQIIMTLIPLFIYFKIVYITDHSVKVTSRCLMVQGILWFEDSMQTSAQLPNLCTVEPWYWQQHVRSILATNASLLLLEAMIEPGVKHGHYSDVIMTTIASQITSLTIVYSIVYSDADQRKHQSSASLAFVRGIHRGPVNFPRKWPVTRKMFPLDDVIMHLIWIWAMLSQILCRFFQGDILKRAILITVKSKRHLFLQNSYFSYCTYNIGMFYVFVHLRFKVWGFITEPRQFIMLCCVTMPLTYPNNPQATFPTVNKGYGTN